jgi:hypothetical protein
MPWENGEYIKPVELIPPVEQTMIHWNIVSYEPEPISQPKPAKKSGLFTTSFFIWWAVCAVGYVLDGSELAAPMLIFGSAAIGIVAMAKEHS